jgi:hypothetical protein
VKVKTLNFVEAGKLYTLLSKYEVTNLDGLSPFQFIERFLEVVIPEDYLEFLRTIFGQDVKEIKLDNLVNAVETNNINILVKVFDKLNGKPIS